MRTIEEKNRIIAEFMGGKDQSKLIGGMNEILFESPSYGGSKPSRIYTPFANLKYHTSWDWLMPVVEAIYNIGLDEQNTNEIGDVTHSLLDVNIHALHNAVVKFIEMYNQQN